MCKVLMIAGIKTENISKVAKFLKVAAKNMSFADDDGVGYAAITKDCHIYGEKWLNKEDAFVTHGNPKPDPIAEKIRRMFGPAVDGDSKSSLTSGDSYTSFGVKHSPEIINNTVAVILHARKATQGDKTLENVHPFVSECSDSGQTPATAIIHNGSIMNHNRLTKTMSTCDSEVILHEYLNNVMYHNPWAIEQLSKTLVGTYTVGVLSSQWQNNQWVPYLDIFKSNKELYAGWVPELETFVFCTSNYTLEGIVKECDMTVQNIFKVKDGFLLRFDAVSGERTVDPPIPFTLSLMYYSSHNNSSYETYRGYTRYPAGPHNGIPATNITTLAVVKKLFERKHSSLFTTPYLESELTQEEKILYQELDKDDRIDHKALRLVSVTLGITSAGT